MGLTLTQIQAAVTDLSLSEPITFAYGSESEAKSGAVAGLVRAIRGVGSEGVMVWRAAGAPGSDAPGLIGRTTHPHEPRLDRKLLLQRPAGGRRRAVALLAADGQQLRVRRSAGRDGRWPLPGRGGGLRARGPGLRGAHEHPADGVPQPDGFLRADRLYLSAVIRRPSIVARKCDATPGHGRLQVGAHGVADRETAQ